MGTPQLSINMLRPAKYEITKMSDVHVAPIQKWKETNSFFGLLSPVKPSYHHFFRKSKIFLENSTTKTAVFRCFNAKL